MPKRFTATEKWDDPWYRNLSCKHKAFWQYICDKCDNAGVWKIDYGLASFQIGEDISESDIQALNTDKERVVLINASLLITGYIQFQIGKLNGDNLTNLQKNCLILLEKYKSQGFPVTGSLPVAYPKLTGIGKGKGKGNIKIKEEYKIREEYIYNTWNAFCDQYPALKKLLGITGTRRKHLKERFTEPAFKNFEAILAAVKKQPFLLNGNPDSEAHKNWRISFDWLIGNDTNYVKVLELRYEKEKVPDYKRYLTKK